MSSKSKTNSAGSFDDQSSSLTQSVLLNRITNRIRQSLELGEILSATVAEVRSFLGTDRIKIYQFQPEGHGLVIAESIYQDRLPSLLGLNFPADDIPTYARELFLRARQRTIIDLSAHQIGISALDSVETGESLETQDIRYRPIDPCHLEYLIAMGLKSSVVVPIVIETASNSESGLPSLQSNQHLWGLLVSHHSEPRTVTEDELMFIQSVVDQVSVAISQSILLQKVRKQAELEANINRVTALLYIMPPVQLQAALEETVAIFQGSGGRLYLPAKEAQQSIELYTCGIQPEPIDRDRHRYIEENLLWQKFLTSVAIAPDRESSSGTKPWSVAWMRAMYALSDVPRESNTNSNIWAIADIYREPLFRTLAPAFQNTKIRGLLIVPLYFGQKVVGCLTIFRDYSDREIAWAGEHDPDTRQLSPRQSFAAWRQMKQEQAQAWTEADIRLAQALSERFSTAVKQYRLYEQIQTLNVSLEQQIQIRTVELQQSTAIANQQRSRAGILSKLQKVSDLESIGRTTTEELRQLIDLRQAKEQYELAVRASHDGFWDWNLVTGEIYYSPRWKEMLGYEDSELANSNLTWASLIFGEDYLAATQLVEEYNTGKVDRFLMTQRFHHKNGSTVYILSQAIHIKDEQGNVIRMIGAHSDITETIRIQEDIETSRMQLSSVLNSSLDGIMVFQSVRNNGEQIEDFEWLLTNPAACKMVGRKAENLIGRHLLKEMPGNLKDGLFERYVQVVETGTLMDTEFYYEHDGIASWFQNIAVKLGDGFAVTFRDITNIKRSEQELQEVNKQLEERVEELKQRNAEMILLSEISDFLQACLTIEEACATITTLVQSLFPDCSGGIFITANSRNCLEMVTSWGNPLYSETMFHPKDCWALRRGRVHWIASDRQELLCNHIDHQHPPLEALCIPMIAQGETLGLLYLSTSKAHRLNDTRQQLARTVAEQVGMAIANLTLRETLQNQSIRDSLTGLFNRRYLEEFLTKEIYRATRNQYSVGIIMIDIDHFKQFNDTLGHDAGDFVLQEIGKLLKNIIRASDVACRYGGEEMTLILPESSLEDTYLKAEKVREAIAELKLNYEGKNIEGLTASFGVACFPAQGITGNSVIQAADAALYRAKAAGRNQVIVANK